MSSPILLRVASLALLLALTTPGCGGAAEEPESGPGPILVLGVDGLEWDVVLPLIREGRMPNLAETMSRGTYGEIETFVPTFSPIIWTTIATGKVKEKHGIEHFVRRVGGETKLYDSRDRRTKALWNILSDSGRSVNTIGWWMTWPVEPVDGLMVAQTHTVEQLDAGIGQNILKGRLRRDVEGQVWPPSRQEEMLAQLEQSEARLPELRREIFGTFPFAPTKLSQRLWDHTQWAFRADATYLDIALALADGPRADVTLVYLGGADVASHRFWRYMTPELYDHPPDAKQLENFGGVITAYYEYVDRALGDLLDAYGPGTNVIVVSDHGMYATNTEKEFDPDDPPVHLNSAEHQQAPAGVFVAAGPAFVDDPSAPRPDEVTRAQLSKVCNVLDVTPTLLELFGVPAGQDMDGHAILDFVRAEARPAVPLTRIPTHDDQEFLDARLRATMAQDPGEAERLKQLRDLGYIGND